MLGIIGGLSLAVGSGLSSAQNYPRFSDQVVTGQFTVSATLRLVGAILMTWGLLAIYLRQADRTGRFGLLAVGACLVNMTLQSGWMFSDLFIAPSIAPIAPQFLNGHSPARLGLAFMLAWIMNTSFILIGIATLRAKVLPRTVGVALIVTGAITAIPLPVDGPIYEVLIGTAFAIAAATALPRTTQTSVPAPTLIDARNDQAAHA
jgi:hypothetical protein